MSHSCTPSSPRGIDTIVFTSCNLAVRHLPVTCLQRSFVSFTLLRTGCLLIFGEIIFSLSQSSVAIVILNWNGKHYLQQFLPSVLATTYSNLRVVVADNASSDDSVSFLKEAFPQVELLILQKSFLSIKLI